jgi:hypothetical protein
MVDQAAAALDAIEFNVLVAQCRIVSTVWGKSIRVEHNKENTMLGSRD